MKAAEWLEVLDREYLQSFIREGGAAVKFVRTSEAATPDDIRASICKTARSANFVVCTLDARQTRLHLIDQLFFEVAKQVDWSKLASTLADQMVAALGYPNEGDARHSLSALAEATGEILPHLQQHVRHWLAERILRNYELSLEFRTALTCLCQAEVEFFGRERAERERELVLGWLRGEKRTAGELRQILIFQKVARNNARHLLFSVARVLPTCGYAGLVLIMDIERYLDDARPAQRADGYYYSKAAMLDMYEVLRQFIDATDELTHTLVVVVGPAAFENHPKRSVSCYDALKLRIWDDVRDARVENPLAPLVRLA